MKFQDFSRTFFSKFKDLITGKTFENGMNFGTRAGDKTGPDQQLWLDVSSL
jgi:hypothetical protein